MRVLLTLPDDDVVCVLVGASRLQLVPHKIGNYRIIIV